MREIKFRAWDKQAELMASWEEIDQLDSDGLEPFLCMLKDGRYHIMQYTGLKDKNGKEIYEGDIVEHRTLGGIDKGPWIGEVTIDPTQGVKVGAWPISFDYEVIGNVYEHPHLLHPQDAIESSEQSQPKAVAEP